jgi:hypothetical protein
MLKEKHRLRMSEKGWLRIILGPEKDEVTGLEKIP